MNENVEVVFSVMGEEEDRLNFELNKINEIEFDSFRTNSASGDTLLWVTLANLAVSSLPVIWDVLKYFLERNRISSIEVDGIKIENPTKSQVRHLFENKLSIRDEEK